MSRTSRTHPLRIDEVQAHGFPGVIGMTFCPGKVQRGALSGAWKRDLETDIAAVRDWGATALINLLQPEEMAVLRVWELPERVVSAGIAYHHLPIEDGGVPDDVAEAAWEGVGADLRRRLRASERIVIHCKGGLGRTGVMAARLLVELGAEPAEAVRLVRKARPGAIENELQERYVLGQVRVLEDATSGAAAPGHAENDLSKPPRTEPRVPADPVRRSRYRGCLLGGAVGDALGAPVEFLSDAEIRQRFGPAGVRDYAPAYGRLGAITDDTQMTLFTAEGLLRGQMRGMLRGVSSIPGVVSHAYLRWLVTQGGTAPALEGEELDGWLIRERRLHARRAPGNTCLAALREATHFGEQARNDSKGCGGVMRVAPVGMFTANWIDLEGNKRAATETLWETFDLGVETAALTHGHPTGQLPAGWLSVAIALAIKGVPLGEAARKATALLRRRKGHKETLSAVERAVALAGERPMDQAALRELGTGWVAEEALAIGLYCALSAPDFESGVVLAVSHGGDSDSTGSIAGNLLGVALGVEAIPRRWLEPLELSDVIGAMADDLATVGEWEIDEYAYSPDQEFYWERYPGW